MSYRIENMFVVQEEPAGKCEYCGSVAELRPYGRNGARICVRCGMLPENITCTMTQTDKRMAGCTVVVDGRGAKS